MSTIDIIRTAAMGIGLACIFVVGRANRTHRGRLALWACGVMLSTVFVAAVCNFMIPTWLAAFAAWGDVVWFGIAVYLTVTTLKLKRIRAEIMAHDVRRAQAIADLMRGAS